MEKKSPDLDSAEEHSSAEVVPEETESILPEEQPQTVEPDYDHSIQSYKSASSNEMPGEVTAIGIFTVISGAVNIITGLTLTFGVILGTLGIGLLCLPVLVLPIVLGVFEIIYGYRLLTQSPAITQPNKVLSILEICGILYLNVISLAAGIVSLVLYDNAKVKEYFAKL